MATATRAGESEIAILARILGAEEGRMSDDLARYILNLDVNERDRARMHDLTVRNQDDGLTSAEKDELFAYGRATTLLSILKSKARRTLGKAMQHRLVVRSEVREDE